MDRPALFSQELANRICAEVATGRMLRDVCSAEDMPSAVTVKDWIEKYPTFKAEYAAAQELQLEQIAEEMFGIADDGSNDWIDRERGDGSTVTVLNGEAIQRSKLRVELRKWWLERLQPNRFGNKVTQQHVGANGGPIQHEDVSDHQLARWLGLKGKERGMI